MAGRRREPSFEDDEGGARGSDGRRGSDLRLTRDDRPAPNGGGRRRRQGPRPGRAPGPGAGGTRPAPNGGDRRASQARRPVGPPDRETGEPRFEAQPRGRTADRADEGMAPRRRDGRDRDRSRGWRDRPPRRRRSVLGRMVYWGFFLSLWAVIGLGGVIAWYAAHLPPIQSLEVPQRPPNVQIL